MDTVKAEGGDVVDAMEALLVGSSRRFSGSRESASRLGSSLKALWGGSMANELDRAGVLPLLKTGQKFFGSGHAGNDFSGEYRRPRPLVRRPIFSAVILSTCVVNSTNTGQISGKLDGYAPQSHDSLKLRRAGEVEWVRYMAEHLDLERTFPDLPEKEVLARLAKRIRILLPECGKTMEKRHEAAPSPPRNLATNLGRERVLHFKDAAGAVEYNRRFGTGNIMRA